MHRYRRRGGVSGDSFRGVSRILSELLRSRGIDTEEKAQAFLHPSLEQLHDPFLMQDMDRAVTLIRDIISRGGKIQVYGDYDTDGVCATSIMLTLFRMLGAHADFRIPSRHTEGYGLNSEAVEEIARDHDLLITVDCGITSVEEVRTAHQLGMKVIVTDHHQVPDEVPEADAVLNPLLGDYPFRRLCGAGVALKICQAMLGREAVEACIDLAALATVADVVPLIDENRVIVCYGMKAMEKGKRPGLQAMIRNAGCTFPMTSTQLAFRLAPRINAGGRLEDAGQCVTLLCSQDTQVCEQTAAHLEENNRLRQIMQSDIIRIVDDQIRRTVDFFDDRCIVVMGEDWNPGVIGLAAGKICETYHMPTVILSHTGEKAVGSCRSVPGVNIHAMLSRCADLFQRFGGHEQAAGLTMDPALVPELRRRLNLAIRENCDEEALIPFDDYDMPLTLPEVTLEMIEDLERMEPTGFGNPSPLFYCQDVFVQQASAVGKDGSHLKLSLLQDNVMCDGIAFGMGRMAGTLQRVDLLVSPQRNEFRGIVKPQVQVESIRVAQGAAAVPGENRIFPLFMQELGILASNDLTIPAPSAKTVTRRQALGMGRGTLYICHTAQGASSLAAEKELDVAVGHAEDPRPFPTLLICPELDRLEDRWKQIVLMDGDVLPGEAALIGQRCPRAEICALKPDKLIGSLREIRDKMSLEFLRHFYVVLRKPPDMDGKQMRALMKQESLNFPEVHTALTVLARAGLIDYALEPLRVTVHAGRKGDPFGTDIMRYLKKI